MECFSKLLPNLLISVLTFSLVSCNAKKDATEFATALETAIVNHDTNTQRLLCPFLSAEDSVYFSFQPDSLEATIKNGVIVARYGNSVRIDIRKDKDGKLTADRSYGLIAYPAEYKEIAVATGQYKSDMDDYQNALRMKDRTFQQYLHFSYIPDNVYPLTLGDPIYGHMPEFMMETGDVKYPVTNRTEISVSGDEYCFEYTNVYIGMGGEMRSEGSDPGMNVHAKGVEYLTMYYTGHDMFDNLRIVFKCNDVSMLRKYANQPQAIYDEFESQYGAVSENPVQHEIFGAYKCKGKIGPSRINGRIVVDSENNTFTGEYGYAGRTAGINLMGTIRADGKFTAYEEDAASGVLCGYYLGTISNNILSGVFQNFKGAKYQFQIDLTKASDN